MRRRLACCTRDTRDYSIDFEEQERIMTYEGLESCILSSSQQSYDGESGTSKGATDFFDDDLESSCCSSTTTNNPFGSFSSLLWTDVADKNNGPATSAPAPQFSDVDSMKEKFAKLLLGEDLQRGGAKGVCSALALSNAITNLSASIFGELWKLEPLPEERKDRWQREMDWLLSPTKHMVELVPAKQHGSNGRTLEIMTPKARTDVSMNLPALRKLDSMLVETLDSMADAEFWYGENEGRGEKAGQSRRWWLPAYPRVPEVGLSDLQRKKLLHHGKLVYQVFKAARAINEHVLAEIPVPSVIKDALPKSGKAGLGEELYGILTSESFSAEEMVARLNLKSEHGVLQTINKLELAILTWKEKLSQQNGGKSPSWSFMKDPLLELDRTEKLINQAEILRRQLKNKYPNLPHTFLDAAKIQFGKDVGHSVLEAYSRVLANLAFRILSRLGDVLQEDVASSPNSPAAMSRLVGDKVPGVSDSPMLDRVRRSLIRRLDSAGDGKSCDVRRLG